MRKSRFTEEQIIGILKEAEAGAKVGEVCRKHGVSKESYYRWKTKYGGMEVSEARGLAALENRAHQRLAGFLSQETNASDGRL